MLGDVGFVFIEVLLVYLVIDQILDDREKKILLEKINMVVGAFFSEIGTTLLGKFTFLDKDFDHIRKYFLLDDAWGKKEFESAKKGLGDHSFDVEITPADLIELNELLKERRDFFLRLLENPNLLEHEKCTELLRSIFHVIEELHYRDDFKKLPKSDIDHLTGDVQRAYRLLVFQWLDYMKHLKDAYPYLFSLARRINPLDENASAVIKE